MGLLYIVRYYIQIVRPVLVKKPIETGICLIFIFEAMNRITTNTLARICIHKLVHLSYTLYTTFILCEYAIYIPCIWTLLCMCIHYISYVYIDQGHVTFVNLFDVRAAFDTVDHGIPLERLEKSFTVLWASLCYRCVQSALGVPDGAFLCHY